MGSNPNIQVLNVIWSLRLFFALLCENIFSSSFWFPLRLQWLATKVIGLGVSPDFLSIKAFLSSPFACRTSVDFKNRDSCYQNGPHWPLLLSVSWCSLRFLNFLTDYLTNFLAKFFDEFFDEFFINFFWRIFLMNFNFSEDFFWPTIF